MAWIGTLGSLVIPLLSLNRQATTAQLFLGRDVRPGVADKTSHEALGLTQTARSGATAMALLKVGARGASRHPVSKRLNPPLKKLRRTSDRRAWTWQAATSWHAAGQAPVRADGEGDSFRPECAAVTFGCSGSREIDCRGRTASWPGRGGHNCPRSWRARGSGRPPT